MSKLYALKGKDVFDISKVTVVGSPSITSDGVVSGFSVSNYLTKTQTFDLSKPFSFKCEFKTSSDILTQQFLFATNMGSSAFGFQIASDLNFYVYYPPKSGNGFTKIRTVTANTTYNYSLDYDGSSLSITLNGEKFTVTNSNFKPSVITFLNIGISRAATQPFTGSIDLTAFKIYVDNQLVFQPTKPTYLLERRKEGYDPSKFTIVGSPTITEYGVASGFGAQNNYVKPINTIVIGSKSWKIKTRFFSVENTVDDKYQNLFVDTKLTSHRQLNIAVNKYGTGIVIEIRNENDDGWLYQTGVYDRKFNTNEWHNLEVIYENQTLSCYVDGNLQHQHSVNLDDKIFSNTQCIGTSLTTGSQINYGSIDLPSFSITVDGKEVFTGAKENYYMVRR